MEYYFSTFIETHRLSAIDCVIKIQMQESLPEHHCFNCVPVT